ncbi:MAG: hypothetical protein M9901_11980, partial [Lentimicrobium sp.]|nr:hypothetical protein [Lentimicrobium sp.]
GNPETSHGLYKQTPPPESEDIQMILGFCKHTTPLESEDEQMIHGFCKYATPPESGNPEKNREVSICM